MSAPALTARPPAGQLSREQLLELYHFLKLNRMVEEKLTNLYRQGKVVGGLYRSLGQEACSVGSAYALERGDIFTPLIRNLGAIFVRGGKPRDVFAQYMAKASGPTRGRDLNVHFGWLSEDGSMPSVISMLGDMIPILTGAVLAERMKGKKTVALNWIGDGGTSTGAFHEGFNLACVQKAPLVLIVENNKYAYSTPTSKQTANTRFVDRAAAYGCFGEQVDGNDVLAVYEVTRRAIERARAGRGPTLIEADTMRMRGHAEHDDMKYVPPADARAVGRAGSHPALREAAAGRPRRHPGGARRRSWPGSTPRCRRTWPRPRPAPCRTPNPVSTVSTRTMPWPLPPP